MEWYLCLETAVFVLVSFISADIYAMCVKCLCVCLHVFICVWGLRVGLVCKCANVACMFVFL